jgi:hypothetical protein
VQRVATQPGTSDRERRERLEQLHLELRQAKAQLADVDARAAAAVGALEDSVARAKEELEAERVRTSLLARRLDEADAEVASLSTAYYAVAARQWGAHLAESWRNMNENPRAQRWGELKAPSNGPDFGMLLLVVPMIGVIVLLVGLMLGGLFQ